MKNTCFVIALFTLFHLNVSAQIIPDSTSSKSSLPYQPNTTDLTLIDNTKKANTRPGTLELHAKEDIKLLKQGILLVRLRTSDNSISQLKKSGNTAKAIEVEKQQQAENKRLISAFKDKFEFCPVYYFYSSDSKKVLQGNLEGVVLDGNLKPISGKAFAGKEYFVAELTDIQQPKGESAEPNQGNISGMTFRALVIRNKNLEQLASPFPFYVKRIQNIPPHTRTESEMVSLLNKKLATYLKETHPGKH